MGAVVPGLEVTLTHPPIEQVRADWDRIVRTVDDSLRALCEEEL